MVSLEQVKLLESRVVRTIEYVQQLSEENAVLRSKLDNYRTRIEELEVLVKDFKEDQSRIEDGILSALDRLSQFEIAVERGISEPPLPPLPPVQTVPLAETVVQIGVIPEAVPAKEESSDFFETSLEAPVAEENPVGEEAIEDQDASAIEDTEETDAGQKSLGAELDIF